MTILTLASWGFERTKCEVKHDGVILRWEHADEHSITCNYDASTERWEVLSNVELTPQLKTALRYELTLGETAFKMQEITKRYNDA